MPRPEEEKILFMDTPEYKELDNLIEGRLERDKKETIHPSWAGEDGEISFAQYVSASRAQSELLGLKFLAIFI